MIKSGVVSWFDESSGEGMIFCEQDNCQYYVHYSAINSDDKFKTLIKGSEVEFTLYTNLYMSQVDSIKQVA